MPQELTEQEKEQLEAEKLRNKAEREIKAAKKSGLEARVKSNYAYGNVIAFSGLEYTKKEWRQVPPGFENQAIVHPLLDVRNAETEKPIEVTSQQVIAQASATSDVILAGSTVPSEAAESDKVINREVEPVGDLADPTVREAKIDAAEEDEPSKKKPTKKK